MCNNFDFSLADLRYLNIVTEIAGSAINFDAVVEELLVRGDVEDFVVNRLGGIDDELRIQLSAETLFLQIFRCEIPSW